MIQLWGRSPKTKFLSLLFCASKFKSRLQQLSVLAPIRAGGVTTLTLLTQKVYHIEGSIQASP